jgi:DNA-binding transcriptional ArsR family regulator
MEQDFTIFDMQAELCQALGHTIRLRIVHALKEGSMCVNELVSELDNVSQPTVSRHLAVLRSVGVLSTQRQGTEVVYKIANPQIVSVCEMMRSILVDRESQQFNLLYSILV